MQLTWEYFDRNDITFPPSFLKYFKTPTKLPTLKPPTPFNAARFRFVASRLR
ncbi:unnamed protein product, partial [Brassica rapa subsp. trilocularis]